DGHVGLGSRRLAIIDLPVEDYSQRPVLVGHGLPGARGEIDDGEAPAPKADVSIHPNALVIGPSMTESERHAVDGVGLDLSRPPNLQLSCDSTHGSSPAYLGFHSPVISLSRRRIRSAEPEAV